MGEGREGRKGRWWGGGCFRGRGSEGEKEGRWGEQRVSAPTNRAKEQERWKVMEEMGRMEGRDRERTHKDFGRREGSGWRGGSETRESPLFQAEERLDLASQRDSFPAPEFEPPVGD